MQADSVERMFDRRFRSVLAHRRRCEAETCAVAPRTRFSKFWKRCAGLRLPMFVFISAKLAKKSIETKKLLGGEDNAEL